MDQFSAQYFPEQRKAPVTGLWKVQFVGAARCLVGSFSNQPRKGDAAATLCIQIGGILTSDLQSMRLVCVVALWFEGGGTASHRGVGYLRPRAGSPAFDLSLQFANDQFPNIDCLLASGKFKGLDIAVGPESLHGMPVLSWSADFELFDAGHVRSL